LNVDTPYNYKARCIIDSVKDWKNKEGVVLVYLSGYRLKIKTRDYVLTHKLMENLKYEKDVLKTIITDQIDDVLPFLNPHDKASIETYRSNLSQSISNIHKEMEGLVNELGLLDKKNIALELKNRRFPKGKCYLFWSVYKRKDFYEMVKEIILKANTSSKLEELRWLVPHKLSF